MTLYSRSVIINHMKSKRKSSAAKKTAVLALMSGLGLISFLIEGLIAPPFLPGAKLGLSNIFTLFTLVLYGLPEAVLVVAARTVLGSLFAGNFSLLLYSLTAGLASAFVSRLLLCVFPRISILCVSVVSAVVHNAVQTLVYCALTGTLLLMGYLPWLAVAGIAAGIAVGIAVVFIVKIVPLSVFARLTGVKISSQTEEQI